MTAVADRQRAVLNAVGKALYGWGDDEPNEATGFTAMYETGAVVAALEPIFADERHAVVERIRERLIEKSGTYDYGYVEASVLAEVLGDTFAILDEEASR